MMNLPTLKDQHTPAATGELILRVFAGFTLAFAHGLGKLPPAQMMIDGVGSMGFPMPTFFAWCAALAEFGGGLLLGLGLLTRPASAFVAFTMIVAVFGAHGQDPFQKKEMACLYLVIALYFLLTGAGRFSLDALFCRKRKAA